MPGGYLRHTRRPSGRAGKPLRPEQQHDDEHGKHRNGCENAAHKEVGGLLKQAEDQPRNDRPANISHAAERDWNETVERQHRRIGEKGEQQLAAGETRQCADCAGKREARDAQVAVRQAERTRRIVVLGDRQEGVTDQRVAVEDFKSDDDDDARDHRQPELLIEVGARHIEDARKRLRLRAPFDRSELLHDERKRERREHIEVLVDGS